MFYTAFSDGQFVLSPRNTAGFGVVEHLVSAASAHAQKTAPTCSDQSVAGGPRTPHRGSMGSVFELIEFCCAKVAR